MAERTADEPLRLIVVGAGAKALFALEELAALLVPSAPRAPRLEITVVDPGEHLGAGAAYHPGQPHHLRLNVGSRILDAPATGDFPSFPDWTRTAHPELAEEPYPPRAIVGEYLQLRWRQMVASLAPSAQLRHLPQRVLAVHRSGPRWQVEVTGSPRRIGPADEVLLATGHASRHAGALAESWTATLPLRPAVLPVQVMLAREQVPPGSRVAMRGGALTFADAAMTLTLGRGARFHEDPADPSVLVHERSPEEPAVILPTTRHGLLLDAKPEPYAPLPASAQRALEDGARRLAAATASSLGSAPSRVLSPSQLLTPSQLLDLVVEVAADILSAADAPVDERRRAVALTLATGAEPDLGSGPGRAEQMLRRSVAVAQGSRAPGPAWALGRTWSVLYPQLTAALRGSDVEPPAWASFMAAAQVLERFAFGPPLDVARQLIALLDSGALDLSWVDAGTTIRADGIHGMPSDSAAADVVIDAVISPPGLVGIIDPLAEQLLSAGLVAVREGRRGAAVEADGTALTPAGLRTEGLALLGRATEDHVIGHDTLNRHLHGETGRWAARIARRTPLEETP